MAIDRKQDKTENIHQAHRERMRSRFFSNDAKSFADHELLEMLLYYAIPRRNTNEQAHELINTLGSLPQVFEASVDTLSQVNGIGRSTAIYLHLIGCVMQRCLMRKSEMENPIQSVTCANADRFFINYYTGRHLESVLLLTFDAQDRLNGQKEFPPGACDYSLVDIPAMLRFAAIHNATSVMCAHNHPDGFLIPSNEDFDMTKKMMHAFDAGGFLFRGHYIVAGKHTQRIDCCEYHYYP